MPKQTNNSSNNAALKGFALTLVILILAVCVMAAMTEGFSNWNPYGWFDKPAEEQQTPEGDDPAPEQPTEEPGGMVTDVQNSSLMTLSAVAATTAAEGAESSTTLTATVAPGDATNKLVDWEVYFANPESEWASGKTLSDYVTLTPTSDGSTTANVDCLQPFGEQIIVKVTSRDNPDATATCTVDYVKKVTSATMSFGDVNVLLGDITEVVWEINDSTTGHGGATNVSFQTSDVYTIEDEFSYSVKISRDGIADKPGYPSDHSTFPMSVIFNKKPDITTDGVMFDSSFFETYTCYVDTRFGSDYLMDMSAAERANVFNKLTDNNNILCYVQLTISGEHNSYEYISFIRVADYTNTSLVSGISLSVPSIVF